MQGPSGRPKDGEGVLEGSVAPAGKKTLETLGAADSIAEALEMAANERQRHEVSHSLVQMWGACLGSSHLTICSIWPIKHTLSIMGRSTLLGAVKLEFRLAKALFPS